MDSVWKSYTVIGYISDSDAETKKNVHIWINGANKLRKLVLNKSNLDTRVWLPKPYYILCIINLFSILEIPKIAF